MERLTSISGGSQDPVGEQDVKVQNWEETGQETGPVSQHISDLGSQDCSAVA